MDAGGRRTSFRGRLAGAGLDPDQAESRLRHAGLWNDEGPTEGTLDLVTEVGETAAPSDALAVICDLAERHPEQFVELQADDVWRRRLLAVAGTSRPLGDLLAQFPHAANGLRDPQPVTAAGIARDVDAALVAALASGDDGPAAIAHIRRRATAEIAARDLTGEADVAVVAGELANLAEGVLTGVLSALHREQGGDAPAARLAVIGMGKLGGFELNYISDVDVVFVHEATGEDEDAAREEARAVFEALLTLLNASTTMGRAYEVDPTLRPEGRDGPLSRSIESFVSYWERWAKTWEFQALIKARPVAGDIGLGERFLAAAEPYVWPERLEPGVVTEIQTMKGRVESKPEVKRHGGREVKLGPGGLRDIEFTVQLLQLVHGRADRTLRATGTLAALNSLARGGYVANQDAATFREAYKTLRTVEHHLQLAQERRTHVIPDSEAKQEWLARSLGFRAEGDRPARADFLRELRDLQIEVRQLHAKLFYRPLLEAQALVTVADGSLTLDSRGLSDEAARLRLEAIGFLDSKGALRDVRVLSQGVSRRARILKGVLPAMLQVFADTPDPDVGLRTFGKLVEAHGSDSKLVGQLRDHPPAAEMLARVLGTSEVAGELLLSQPTGTRFLVDDGVLERTPSRDELVQSAVGKLMWKGDLEAQVAGIRRFKRAELLRIVLRDLGAQASATSVGDELTGVAEACLEVGLQAVMASASGEQPAPARVAIVGMGKFGGGELNYVSDLDVIFIHAPAEGFDEATASDFARRVAEQTIKVLGQATADGTAFEIDADLRPEGRDGPLSRTLEAYREYYERWSEPWEHQAMLRARHVAGDADLTAALLEITRPLAYPAEFTDRAAQAMRKMKARIERERIRRSTDPKAHLKLGPGGITDIEWTIQLLQQRHGARNPQVRMPGTMAALDGLQDVGLVDIRDVRVLRDGYRFLTRTRNHLYLLRQRNVDVLPKSYEVVERLARSLDYGRGGRQEYEEDHLRHTRRVRAVVERVFYEVEEQA